MKNSMSCLWWFANKLEVLLPLGNFDVKYFELYDLEPGKMPFSTFWRDKIDVTLNPLLLCLYQYELWTQAKYAHNLITWAGWGNQCSDLHGEQIIYTDSTVVSM